MQDPAEEEREEKCCCVCVDPGHGGKDPGATGACKRGDKEVLEKDIAQEIAQRVHDEIDKIKCCRVILTKEKAEDSLAIRERPKKCADKGCTGFFLGIHLNAGKESAAGTEVLYPGKEHKTEAAFKAGKECAEKLAAKVSDALGTTNRGAKERNDLGVLKGGPKEMPAVIVEVGFLTNEDECKKLIDADTQKKIAKAIAEVACACCKEHAGKPPEKKPPEEKPPDKKEPERPKEPPSERPGAADDLDRLLKKAELLAKLTEQYEKMKKKAKEDEQDKKWEEWAKELAKSIDELFKKIEEEMKGLDKGGKEKEQEYVVQEGDTLRSIALRFYGDADFWKLIFEANKDVLKDPNKLKGGQKLKIPPKPE